MIKIFNESCLDTMQKLPKNSINIVLTSPFYNTNKKAGKKRTLQNSVIKDGQYSYIRYDRHVDNMTDEDYCDFTVSLFNGFNRVLSENGSVLYNICYGSENTEGMFKAINSIITRTVFTIADVIVWKKSNAFPNSCSPNKLTRIWEFVFIFCRKPELKTFKCNKKVTSLRKTGQKAYENILNFIEAKNNDGYCPYNKATFSTDLCKKLLSLSMRLVMKSQSTTHLWGAVQQLLPAKRWDLIATEVKYQRTKLNGRTKDLLEKVNLVHRGLMSY